MRRLSSDLDRRIIELWFKGFPRDSMARTLSVAAGTVSNIIATLPPCLQELRDLSVRLRKIDALPTEALKGADLLAKLDQLGVEPTQLSSLIEALEKQSEAAGYEPAQTVQATLALHNLEKESGKSYVGALIEFRDKTKQTQELTEKIRELLRRTSALEEEREQALQKAKTTDKEIENLKTIEKGLRKHGLSLSEAQSLLSYLGRVKEMGGSPELFLEFSKNYASLQAALKRIQYHVEQENHSLHTRKEAKTLLEAQITQLENDLVELEMKKAEALESVQNLKKEEFEISGKIVENRIQLAEILQVSNNSKEIIKAISDNELKLAQLKALNLKCEKDKLKIEADLRNIQNQLAESNHEKENLDLEINERLKIKNFVAEVQEEIDRLKQEKISLEENVAQRREEVALLETLKNFYVRQTQYDFWRFYYWVEMLKYIRELKPETPQIIIAQTENDIRQQALQVFKDYLVPKSEFEALEIEKNKIATENNQLKSEAQELKNSVKTRDAELTTLTNENQLLAKIKLTVESGQTTLKSLRDWMILQYNEEIGRRADEKYNATAAAAYGTIQWISEKVARANR